MTETNAKLFLLQATIPELWRHFSELAMEVHLFASQWFLTLFTAKFPLPLVYPILDVVFSEVSCLLFPCCVS